MTLPARVRGSFRSISLEDLVLLLLALLLFSLAVIPCLAQTAQAPPAQKPQAIAEKPQPTIAEKIAASKALLDINTATPAQLKALPGMGDAYIARIIAGRPYTAKNQLATRGILPQAAYEAIKDQIIAHRPR